jgi:ligand-binding sensor domain-containing protein
VILRPKVAAGLLAGALACASSAWALDPGKAISQYNQKAWTTVEGLPQASVQAIAQTRDGYLWLGTRAGLVRFNGQGFTVFDPANTTGIGGRIVTSLLAGSAGALWIGTDGKGITRYGDGAFLTLGPAQGLESVSGNALHEDRSGALWFGTWTGLYRFDGRTAATRLGTKEGLPHNSVFAFASDERGTVWAATTGGLAELRDGRVTSVRRDLAGLPQCLARDHRGDLWIGTVAGLDRIDGSGKITHFTTRDGLLADYVTALAEDRDGNLWIGTEGGLNRLSGGRFEAYSVTDGLPGNAVASLLEDREGNLWVGLRGSGLVRLREGSVTTYTRGAGLSQDDVTCVFQSSDRSLWIGTTHGLTRYRDGRFRVFTRRDGLPNDSILGIGEDRRLGLVVATYTDTRKLSVFRGDRFEPFQPLTLEGTMATVVLDDRAGALWVGTLGGGLFRARGGSVEHFTFPSDGQHVIYGALEDSKGTLWFATPNGLKRYRDGSFTNIEIYRQDAANLGVLHSIHEDRDGNLWIATRDRGVCRLRDGGTARCYSRAEGLFDDTVYQILEDDADRLWLSTPRGIAMVARKDFDALDSGALGTLPSRSFGVADGMMTAECRGTRWPAGWKADDGRLWFPTTKGVVVVDPRRLEKEGAPPPVVVEGVRVDGRLLGRGASLSAPPGRGEVEVSYAGLSYGTPERTRFRHRLEGFDPDWIEARGRRVAHYTNIPPGRYVFRVTAASGDGPWNEAVASFQLRLAPHFYQTPAWYALIAVASGLLFFTGYRWRVRQLRARAEELSRNVKEAVASVRVLRGLLPICASCKRVRSDKGYWEQIEAYLRSHSEAEFTHGICPDCLREQYPQYADRVLAARKPQPPN